MRLLPILWATLHHHTTKRAAQNHHYPYCYRGSESMSTTSTRPTSATTISALFSTAPTNSDSDSSSNDSVVHRILCYGDSLTAGTSISLYDLFPYAPHLEAALNSDTNANNNNNIKYVVRHRGMPGWTASAMVDATDDPQYGLRAAIQGIQNPPLSCVIILAGSNDLGYALAGANDNPVQAVLQPIQALHEIAWAAGVTNTIAVAIPPSGYQARVAEAAFLALEVNQALEDFCEASSTRSQGNRATFVPFPFDFEFVRDHDDTDTTTTNWSPDGLHFSPKGYQVLGESLREPVSRVLTGLV